MRAAGCRREHCFLPLGDPAALAGVLTLTQTLTQTQTLTLTLTLTLTITPTLAGVLAERAVLAARVRAALLPPSKV